MQHGEILLRVTLHGEPQKLLTYWRGSLRDLLPTLASITIIKQNRKPPRSPWWSDIDPNFSFEAMTRTEKKRAELSISEKALAMTAAEIEAARHLTEIIYDWISSRGLLPSLSQVMPNARISLVAEGNVELINVIEKFGDPEVLYGATVGAIFTQGEPRRPDVRWLPTIVGVNQTAALEELRYFESSLAPTQADDLRKIISRVAGVFQKALNSRKAKLNKRVTEVLGYSKELEIGDRAITDDMIEGHEYRTMMDWLDGEAKKKKPAGDIRSWRQPKK